MEKGNRFEEIWSEYLAADLKVEYGLCFLLWAVLQHISQLGFLWAVNKYNWDIVY